VSPPALTGRRGVARSLAWWRARRRRLLKFWAIGGAVSVVVSLVSFTGALEGTQARTLDLLMRLHGQRAVSDVVIIAIDEDAFDALGQRQPLSRAYLARLLKGLQRAGAAVVGLDIVYETATAEDAVYAAAVRSFSEGGISRVVLTSMLPEAGPLAELRSWPGLVRGLPDVPKEPDGMIRQAALVLAGPDGAPEPALSAAVAARFAGLDRRGLEAALAAGVLPGSLSGDKVRVGRPGELRRINYVGPARSFLTIPAGAIVALAESDTPPAADNPLRGKIALVGATFRESRDFFDTPHGELPGVEVHANLVHMILTRSFIAPPTWLIGLGFQLVVVIGAGFAVVTLRPLTATLVCFVGPLVVGLPLSYLAFHRGGYWVDFMLPVITTRLFARTVDHLEGRRFRAAFGRYVSPEVAARVLEEAPSLAGERRTVSILFSDLRDFTTFSEKMDPAELASRLSEYFDAMTKAIFKHRGMVNDFIGDAVMAIFGAPLDDPEHALHAARSAMDMERALVSLNATWAASGLPPLRMGIGVHTGEVFAGNVGGKTRFKYTLIGDPVNVASRVEGVNKELNTSILITEATYHEIATRVEAKDCGEVHVKGRDEPVRVYTLLGIDDHAAPARRRGEG
jgi:adenylate cyclase